MKNLLAFFFIIASVSIFAQNPNRQTAEEYLKRGELMMERANFVDAVSNFTHAIKADNTFAEAYYKRALALKRIETEMEGLSYCDDMKKASTLGSTKAKKELTKADCNN